MKIHVTFCNPAQPSEPRKDLEKAHAPEVVVLVDVFRSSTTIVKALDNGAKFVVPCSSHEEAKKIRDEYRNRNQDVLLSGEILGVTPKGFDLNISPHEMEECLIKDKVIIYCSTNLTRILTDCPFTKTLTIGGLTNAKAVAQYLNTNDVKDVVIVACGILGTIALEDVIGAGAIVSELCNEELSDSAKIALLAYQNPGWRELIFTGWTARHLRKIGYSEDLTYCTKENSSNTVPILIDWRFIKL